MRNHAKIAGAAIIASSLVAGTASFAAMSAMATTDLNIRSGPGPQFDVVGVIGANEAVNVDGCVEGNSWCRVQHGGTSGWSYSDYLAVNESGSDSVVVSRVESVPTVNYTGPAAATGAAGGAVIGALVAGPVGAVIGGAIGAGIGASAPPPAVTTYVEQQRYDPVYLDGAVVVGAGVPENVELRAIPDYEYRYAVVNGQTVLVDAKSREIVYVYR
jgi:uncharacterized protein YraI